MRSILMLLLLIPFFSFSHANEYDDGHELLSNCKTAVNMMDRIPTSGSALKAGYCMGLIRGMSDMNTIYSVISSTNSSSNDIYICVPDKTPTGQLTRDVVNFLEKNPDDLYRPYSVLISAALATYYPCN